MPPSNTIDSIVAGLRAKICLLDADEPVTLHETALAAEFGVSRTPVRQALQNLAYEQLVTVRSGVGTIVVPLEEINRERDVIVTCVLLGAAADAAMDGRLPAQTQMNLAGYAGMLSSGGIEDAARYLELRSRFLETVVEAVEDTILRMALSAAYWRLLRWRMESFRTDPEAELEWCRQLMSTVLEATDTGSAKAVFEAIALLERAAE